MQKEKPTLNRSKEHWRCITRIKEHTRIVCPLVIHYVKLQIVYQEKKYICRNCLMILFQVRIMNILLPLTAPAIVCMLAWKIIYRFCHITLYPVPQPLLVPPNVTSKI